MVRVSILGRYLQDVAAASSSKQPSIPPWLSLSARSLSSGPSNLPQRQSIRSEFTPPRQSHLSPDFFSSKSPFPSSKHSIAYQTSSILKETSSLSLLYNAEVRRSFHTSPASSNDASKHTASPTKEETAAAPSLPKELAKEVLEASPVELAHEEPVVVKSSPKASTSSLLSRVQGLIPTALRPPENTTSSIKKLLELARPEKNTILWAIGLLIISSVVSMSIPLTIGKIIDFFTNSDSSTFYGLTFGSAAALLTLFFIFGAMANAGRAILMRLAGQRIISTVRNKSYSNVLKQEVEFADRGVGDIVSRLGTDITIVGESVTTNLSDGLRSIISATVGVAAMFLISAKLTFVMLGVVPPISLGAVFYGRYLRTLSNETQTALGDMSRVAEEKLSAFRTVTSFNAQELEEKTFSEKVDKVFQLARKEAIASGFFYGGTGLTGNLAMLCLLGYGGHLVASGEITVGALTSLLMYTGYVGGSVSGLTGFFTGLMKGVGAGVRVFDLLDRTSSISPNTGVPLPLSRNGPITFEKVNFSYPTRKDVPILKGLDLTIERGQSLAIVGKSGSGKSSIQSLLMRFYDPDGGKVTFDGEDVRNFTVQSWRSRFGIVPQDPPLFNATIRENIIYGIPNVSQSQIHRAISMANCDFVWDLPEGLDTPVGKASLSGGQKQRIAIARALVRNPTVLLLDEATSALDSAAEHQVNQALSSILAERSITVVLVAHRLSSIARAERVAVIEDGKVVELGTYTELSTREGSRFRELMSAQLETKTGVEDAQEAMRVAGVEEQDGDEVFEAQSTDLHARSSNADRISI